MTSGNQMNDSKEDRTVPVVLSGSFRKAPDLLTKDYKALQEANCEILSPSNVEIVDERRGFVFMKGEEHRSPKEIEDQHIRAIQNAAFVWFHAPEGYIGLSGAFEVGFAHANGVPVYSDSSVKDETLHHFITTVNSPREARKDVLENPVQIPPALRSMQEYYKRATMKRGHDEEDVFDCIEFLKEEVQELEEVIPAERSLLAKSRIKNRAQKELADVFLYTIHMANILEIDLSKAVEQKENINQKRFSSNDNE